MFMLSPIVQAGLDREATKHDFSDWKLLGKGAFGEVYRVYQSNNQKNYAIKQISKKDLKEAGMESQAIKEVKIMYSLNQEHIVKLYNHFEDDVNCYLVLEFLEGGELYKKLKASPGSRFDEKTTAAVIYELCQALMYLHGKNIIHRDIKPENILLNGRGSIKLADFGWSSYEEKAKKRDTYAGTLDYLAPEMVSSTHQHDHWIDIWCVGVLMYELLTGKPPFSPESMPTSFGLLQQMTKENIQKLKFSFPGFVPPMARDLIRKV